MVSVYWNRHRKLWSLLGKRGLVSGHEPALTMADVRFVVRPGGRARAVRERKRNVHAFARGVVVQTDCRVPKGAVRVNYNPFHAPHFYEVDSGESCESARMAFLTPDGKLYATR